MSFVRDLSEEEDGYFPGEMLPRLPEEINGIPVGIAVLQ
jgi:hypothetical protein